MMSIWIAQASAAAAAPDQGWLLDPELVDPAYGQTVARGEIQTAFPAPPPPPLRPREAQVVWKEKKGPRCVAMKNIVRMEAVQRDSIDLITRQKQLLRAQLNRGCRALDFYAGFYMKGNKDGQLCEGRDEIHARTGAKCEVDEFRLLVPVARDDD